MRFQVNPRYCISRSLSLLVNAQAGRMSQPEFDLVAERIEKRRENADWLSGYFGSIRD